MLTDSAPTNNRLQVKRDKLLRPAGTELTAYGFGVLLDFWVSELKSALRREGVIKGGAAAAAATSEEKAATPDRDAGGTKKGNLTNPQEIQLPSSPGKCHPGCAISSHTYLLLSLIWMFRLPD